MSQDKITAGGKGIAQRGHDPPGICGIADERQHRDEQQPGRLADVDQPPGGLVGEDLLRLAQVGVDDRRVLIPGQESLAVRDGDRVNVDIDHPGIRAGLLGDLMHVPLSRDAGANIQELAIPASVRNRTARPRKSRLAGRSP